MLKISKFLFILILFSACQNDSTTKIAPPMVDGKLNDFIQLNVSPIALSEEVNLYIYQDEHYVWLGYDYPEGSFGTLDLQIETDSLENPLNLHVSAQLGEWVVGDEANQPQTSDSDLWWEFNGWISNEVWMNGMTRTEERTSPNFKNAKARELQLSKAHFGLGAWKLKFNIRAIVKPDGSRYNIDFPNDDSDFILEVY